jgi:inosine-uridine nucleoside N-ribohydrolase
MRKQKRSFMTIVMLLVTLTLGACQSSPAQPTAAPTATPPRSVIGSWNDALNAGDVDAALAFLVDDAVVQIVPPPPGISGVFNGKQEIRGWYDGLVSQDCYTEVSNIQADGDKVSWSSAVSLDEWRGLGIAPLHFTGEGVLHQDQFKSYTVTMSPDSLELLIGSAPAAWPEATPTMPPKATPIVIDTDMAQDDVMAILYLLKRPDVDVKAITVAGTGMAYCQEGTRHALGLVALAGAAHIPVACGREEPLQGYNALPTSWRSDSKSFPGLDLPETGAVSEKTAVDLLTATIRSSPQKVVLLTLGPLTNVGEALQHSPELADNLEMIYILAGAVDVPGNIIKNDVADWNAWVDPHAANLVFEAGAPITLVPLDATNLVPVTVFHYEALRDNHFTPEATAVFDMLTGNPSLYRGGLYVWDPLAAAILADESLASFEPRRLTVIEEGREQMGRTLESEDGVEVRVAVSADAQRFEQEFLSTLNDGREVSVSRTAPDVTITFDGDACTSKGLETVEKGPILVALQNRGGEEFAMAIFTLHEGKTREDLDAWEGAGQPPWTDLVALASAPPRGNPLWVLDLADGTNFVACLALGSNRVWPQTPMQLGE